MTAECFPLLDADLPRFCALPGLGALTPKLVQDHAPDGCMLLRQAGRDAARCSLWWRLVPSLPGERLGLIGHYAAHDVEAGAEILVGACEHLGRHGCTLAVGPMDGTTWRRYRLLTWRGSEPLFFLEPDNPDDWPLHFEKAAFAPLAHYFSAKCQRIGDFPCDQDLDRTLRGAGYTVRCMDPTRSQAEIGLLWRLATDAFSGNYLYSPVAEDEFRSMYAALIPVLRPELVHVCQQRGEPVGFVFAVPDVLQASRAGAIDTVVVKTLGVIASRRRAGLGAWLLDVTVARARELGYRQTIHALMHETNPSRRLGRGQSRDIRRYTLFGRRL